MEYSPNILENVILQNSIVFKGNSKKFSENLEEIKNLSFGGKEIYPPTNFPTIGEPIAESFFSSYKKENEGRLSPPEAVGMLTILNEGTVLAQIANEFRDDTDKLREIFGLNKNEWPDEFVDGFLYFEEWITSISTLRDNYYNNIMFGGNRDLWENEKIGEALNKDGYKIGENTTKKLIKLATNKVDAFDTEFNKDNQNIKKEKKESKQKGAECARALYLEAVNLAEKI